MVVQFPRRPLTPAEVRQLEIESGFDVQSYSGRALAAIGLLVIAALLIFVGVVIGLALA